MDQLLITQALFENNRITINFEQYGNIGGISLMNIEKWIKKFKNSKFKYFQ